MICDECNNNFYGQMISTSECESCERKIETPHFPPYKYCTECSRYLGKCKQCGKDVWKDE